MKQVVVEAYCDLCADAGQENVPATEEMTFEGYLLDLCERHQTQVSELLVVLNGMFQQGVKADEVVKPPPRPRKSLTGRRNVDVNAVHLRTCPDCGHLSPTRSANGQHVKQKHDKRLRDYDWST